MPVTDWRSYLYTSHEKMYYQAYDLGEQNLPVNMKQATITPSVSSSLIWAFFTICDVLMF